LKDAERIIPPSNIGRDIEEYLWQAWQPLSWYMSNSGIFIFQLEHCSQKIAPHKRQWCFIEQTKILININKWNWKQINEKKKKKKKKTL